MRLFRNRHGAAVLLGAGLLLLSACGGDEARGPAHRQAARGGNFMGVTQARCDNGDAGACRILRATGS